MVTRGVNSFMSLIRSGHRLDGYSEVAPLVPTDDLVPDRWSLLYTGTSKGNSRRRPLKPIILASTHSPSPKFAFSVDTSSPPRQRGPRQRFETIKSIWHGNARMRGDMGPLAESCFKKAPASHHDDALFCFFTSSSIKVVVDYYNFKSLRSHES